MPDLSQDSACPPPHKRARGDDFPQSQWPPKHCTPGTRAFHPHTNEQMRYIVVSGGVCSSLGKGTTTSSIGALLKGAGYRVTAIKLDPYINVDAGLMSPFEHGEVYVLDDGGETDLDLGNYERWIDLSLQAGNNITTGKIYESVINRERKGEYLGRTVQVVPHVTGRVREWIDEVAQVSADNTGLTPQICLIELGGTVGDIESMPFIEALRQLKFSLPDGHLAWCHVSYLPVMGGQKTKPTQHTVKTLLSLGLQADLLVCRASSPLEAGTKKKISNQCNIRPDRIFSAHDIPNLFHLPGVLAEQNILKLLKSVLKLDDIEKLQRTRMPPPLSLGTPSAGSQAPRQDHIKTEADWRTYALKVDEAAKAEEVVIALVGKYHTGGSDAYMSLYACCEYAAYEMKRKLRLVPVDAEHLAADIGQPPPPKDAQEKAMRALKSAHGILVPGGFGVRGVEGKVLAASLARKWKKPYLGICLGFQVAVVAFARDELKLHDANSEEFDKSTPNAVIKWMPVDTDSLGGTMRLGAQTIDVVGPKNCILRSLYGGLESIEERHRHRYEVNAVDFRSKIEEAGLIFSGVDDKNERMEAIELPRSVHPFYLAVQYHPEYKTRPGNPSPPYWGLLAAAAAHNPESGTTDSKVIETFLEERGKHPCAYYQPRK
eukprot:Hpha_TRINITY_DN16362_c0_g9::TRINITY_DN16362_c0_g9_i1::g.59487::m.59487/K01937/pyrG, CTPS; CTP synthase